MLDYEDKYLKSSPWQAFRKRVLEVQKVKLGGCNRCEQCLMVVSADKLHDLHVHHLTYERLGDERFEDVLIICRECHDEIHLRDAKSWARHFPRGHRT